MKIVVLDGYAMNPGDLSWEPLEALGEVKVYDRSPEAEVAERIGEADVALTNKSVIGKAAMEACPNLKYVGVMATGYNVVDMETAKAKGITVTNVPGYSTHSVAQLTFSLLLELTNHVQAYADSVERGDWVKSEDFSYQVVPQVELFNKTLAIIGLGKIGQAVAKIGLGFGMRVIASHRHPERDALKGVTFVDEETCFEEADVLTLHCPLNEQNRGFVNKEKLGLMKSSAFLINTSRGPLINESDLAEALDEGVLAGAGLDVLSSEPPSADNPLLKAKNCLITPHVAWSSFEARSRLMETVVANIQQWKEDEPQNVVG